MDIVAKALVKKTLKESANKKINSSDPYEERVEVYDKRGRPTGKYKKQKRGIPQGLSANDAAILKKVRRRAYRLDMSLFNCCGIRFGWSSVVGLIPVIGDAIDALMALMVVRTCGGIDGGLPQMLRARMMFNIALDFGIGLVPLLGDIADAVFRANTRNAWLLEVYLQKKIEAERKGHVSDPDLGNPQLPSRPPNARLQSNNTRGGSLFGQGRTRQPDVEMAMDTLGSNSQTRPGTDSKNAKLSRGGHK
ncbi:PH domain-containing protein [Thozetella sp. PMI_491]|nr:PH domain-containing protein [Thozetella sp. PMI_491]